MSPENFPFLAVWMQDLIISSNSLCTFGNRVVFVPEALSTAPGVSRYLGTRRDYPTQQGQLLVITRSDIVQPVWVVGLGVPYKSIC